MLQLISDFGIFCQVLALIGRMERLSGAPMHRNISRTLELHLEAIQVTQARRKDEIGNAANPQGHGVPRYNNEKGNAALKAALLEPSELSQGFNCESVPLENVNLQCPAILVTSAKESLKIRSCYFLRV